MMTEAEAAALTLEDWIFLCNYALSRAAGNGEAEIVLYNLLNLLEEEQEKRG